MIFDTACRVAEKSFPVMRDILRRAALFTLEGNPEEFSNLDLDEDSSSWFMENFMLPFPITAIEDNATLVILMDPPSKSKEDILGADVQRVFVEIMDLTRADSDAFKLDVTEESKAEFSKMSNNLPKDTVQFHSGVMRIPKILPDGKLYYEGIPTSIVMACPEKILMTVEDEKLFQLTQQSVNSILTNVGVAWQQVMYLNTPGRFVLETSSVKQREHVKQHIPRSHERPRYTILNKGEIRRKMRLSDQEPTGRHAEPHWRRRHFRRLTADRFVNKKGQVIAVRQAWIGPTEAVVDGKKYRVLLNR